MTRRSLLGAGILALVSAACGSGSDDPGPRSAFVQATVGAGGTLSVGGIPFRTQGAVLRLLDDDTNVTLGSDTEVADHLREGMVVSVKGTLDADGRSGAASEILYRSVLRGPLEGRSDPLSLLAVAGADVVIGADTVVLDAGGARTTVAALTPGERVEVSGWPERGARVRATLVRALPGTPAVAVRGWTLAANAGVAVGLSLLQGGAPLLLVDLASVQPAPVFPASALVRVGGTAITAGSPPVLTGTSLAVEAQLLPLPGDRAVIEGVVTSAAAPELALGEHPVRTTSATTFAGLPTDVATDRPIPAAAALGPGARIVAEGTHASGTLVADRVRFAAVRLAGRIRPGSFAIGNPSTTGSFELAGAIVVLGPGTVITDATGTPLTIVQLVNLHGAELAGLPVAVVGTTASDGSVQAARVEVTAG